MTTELLRLAELCEQASGPDEQLDFDIAEALELQPTGWASRKGKCSTMWPRVTASLDAAMTLVPDEMEWRVERRFSKGMHPAYASLWSVGARDIDHHANGHGKTAALALVAASLRARSQESNHG